MFAILDHDRTLCRRDKVSDTPFEREGVGYVAVESHSELLLISGTSQTCVRHLITFNSTSLIL